MFFVFGWFESLALVLVCLGLLGVGWRAARIVFAATVLCAGVGVIRSLSLVIGTNTVFAILLLALLVSWLFSVSFAKSLVAASCALILLLFLEIPIMLTVNSFADITVNPYVWLLGAMPHVILLYAIAFVIRSKNLKIFS